MDLLTSLLAQKVGIPRGGALQNELGKHVLPVFNIFPIKSKEDRIKEDNADQYNALETWKEREKQGTQFFPLSLQKKGDTKPFLLPFEPMINISGKNNVIKRNVAKSKGRGTIKERWSQDDFTIAITCILMDEDMKNYPTEDFEKLRDYLIIGQALQVFCEPLQLLNINRIVIEDFSVPFTKGENMQAFTINSVSDDSYNLLIETKEAFGGV